MTYKKMIHIEPLARRQELLSLPLLTQSEIEEAIVQALRQLDLNMAYFNEQFPFSATENLIYPITENKEWTEGFWTGMLWLAYELTHERKYRELAERNCESFYHRISHRILVDHHDLGFLYTPSCVAAWKLIGNRQAKEAALMAADQLLSRFQEKGQFIQAWGEFGRPEHYRFIIDCLLNLPLLYWAAETTGKTRYKEIAQRHLATAIRYVIRDDASAFHTFFMDPNTGEPIRGVTHQGYCDDSSWARGQAWGIAGLPLNYRYLHDSDLIPLYRGMTHYFLNRLPQDWICCWDLIFVRDASQPRDSSAAAIACCGLLEMNAVLPETDPDKEIFRHAAHAMLHSLIQSYTSENPKPGAPLLYHGVYSWHSKKGVDEGNLWGDYFFLEALVRMSRSWSPYW